MKLKWDQAIIFGMFSMLLVLGAGVAQAKEDKKNEPVPAAAVPSGVNMNGKDAPLTEAEQQKRALVANVMELRNQELRTGVLEQLYNQETISLRQKQAFFCDLYKLDVEKFRKGLYQYDEATAKFVEKAPEAGK